MKMMQVVEIRQLNQMVRFVHLVLDKKFVGIQEATTKRQAS